MRSWTALLIAALFGIGAASQSSARMASHIRTIPAKQFIDLAPGEYQAGSIAIHVREVRGKENPHNFIVDFSSHGRKPLRVQIDDHGFDVTPPTFAVGQLEKTGPAVFFVESFSGGAHCCAVFRFVIPTPSGFKIAKSQWWDGDMVEDWPKDIDGDGRADIVRNDNAFLYAFASYAESFSPPLVLNLIGGRVQDVSTKPSFRNLFADHMRNSREECLRSGGRGACAAYVADAARLGSFKTAWTEMLGNYDRQSDWLYPDDCGSKFEAKCNAGRRPFKNYPDALLHLLKKMGYVPSGVSVPLATR